MLLQGMVTLAHDIGGGNGAVIAKRHENEQFVPEVLCALHSMRHNGGGMGIEQHNIRLAAHIERTDLILKLEGAGIAQGHGVKGGER